MSDVPADVWRFQNNNGVSQWRDISTAPKDGTKILVWSGSRVWQSPDIAYWGRNHPLNPSCWVGGHCQVGHIDQPTHWMPLPSPPEPSPNGLGAGS